MYFYEVQTWKVYFILAQWVDFPIHTPKKSTVQFEVDWSKDEGTKMG